MTDDFETPADIPYCLEPGKWITGATFFERFLADIELRQRLANVCESPIEIDLAAALMPLLGERYILQPQFKLARFRYDFVVTSLAGKPLLLIECDSKEFHSTAQQKANDRAKDKAAIAAGIPLERVTGSEIFYAVKLVAHRLLSVIEAAA